MYTYTLTMPAQFAADDPTTPVSGSVSLKFTVQADTLDDAKAAFATALGGVVITGIVVIPVEE